MATNNFSEFIALESGMTVETAINGATLYRLEKTIKKSNIIKALSFFITHFNNNFNAKGKLNESQIIVLAGDLFETFKYESLEDAMLMFKYARQGKIGDGKDFKLDSQTIYHKWLPEYMELKAIERERQHNDRKHNSFKITDLDPEILKKVFEGVGEEEVDHSRKGGGVGSVYKKKLKKAKVITNRTDFLVKIQHEAEIAETQRLKDYILSVDVNSERFDAQVYEIVEKELDKRKNE